MITKNTPRYIHTHPVLAGVFGVLAVLVVGAAVAFATGFVTPESTNAQVACCVVTPPPPPPPPQPPPPPPPPVVPIIAAAPTCDISASANTIALGDTTTLSWNSVEGTNAEINNGIGGVGLSGSRTIAPTSSGTYTLTISGVGGITSCNTSVTVTAPVPLGATCSAVSGTAHTGDVVTWNVIATGANGVYAYNWSGTDGLGGTNPSLGFGYTSAGTKTATVTVTSGAESVTTSCTAEVLPVVVPPGAASCTLSVVHPFVTPGSSTVLSWTTTNANSFVLDNGIGLVPYVGGSETIFPLTSTTYTGTVTGADGSTASCATAVAVTIDPVYDAPACTLSVSDDAIVAGETTTLSWTRENALFAYLDNGIGDLPSGATGTMDVTPAADTTYTLTVGGPGGADALCTASVAVSALPGGGGGGTAASRSGGGNRAASVSLEMLKLPPEAPFASVYLSQIPYTGLSLGPIGLVLYWLGLIGVVGVIAYALLFMILPRIKKGMQSFVAGVQEILSGGAAPTAAPEQKPAPVVVKEEAAPKNVEYPFSPLVGFRSFGSPEKITVDDIVKGLSRMPVAEFVETVTEPIRATAVAAAQTVTDGYRALIKALAHGNREEAFTILRESVRAGEAPHQLMTKAVCALDDVYRSRIDGVACDPEVQELCAACDTPALERMVSSLTTAVDASYSTDVTAAKLALVRALDSVKK